MQLLEEKMYNKLEGYDIIHYHDKGDDWICVGLYEKSIKKSNSIIFYYFILNKSTFIISVSVRMGEIQAFS